MDSKQWADVLVGGALGGVQGWAGGRLADNERARVEKETARKEALLAKREALKRQYAKEDRKEATDYQFKKSESLEKMKQADNIELEKIRQTGRIALEKIKARNRKVTEAPGEKPLTDKEIVNMQKDIQEAYQAAILEGLIDKSVTKIEFARDGLNLPEKTIARLFGKAATTGKTNPMAVILADIKGGKSTPAKTSADKLDIPPLNKAKQKEDPKTGGGF